MLFPTPNRRQVATLMLVCYWLLLFVGTHLPGRLVHGIRFSDKFLHLGAFAGLAFLLAYAFSGRRPTPARLMLVAVVASCYGAFDELSQLLIPSRTADFYDWIADMLGVGLGILTYTTLVSWLWSAAGSPSRPAADAPRLAETEAPPT